jgi:hypothetical protein
VIDQLNELVGELRDLESNIALHVRAPARQLPTLLPCRACHSERACMQWEGRSSLVEGWADQMRSSA